MLKSLFARKDATPKLHFVEDYERHVKNLMRKFPLDEAMSLAVGGGYDRMGEILAKITVYAGAKDGDAVLDFGCGSGRLAHKLKDKVNLSSYLGIDVVQELLDYAQTKTPSHYRFLRHQELSIPAASSCYDIACAFSVFTHLLQTETFVYMREICRALKPGGRFIFSFLQFDDPQQWAIFEQSVAAQRAQTLPHLNMFLDTNQIRIMTQKAGFKIVEYLGGIGSSYDGPKIGQSVYILDKIP